MTHKFALPEPATIPGAPEDGTVMEVARVWINPAAPSITVRPAFRDPKAMGQMLAELCWNFAHAYERQGGLSQAQALEALRAGWVEGHAMGDAAEKRRSAQ